MAKTKCKYCGCSFSNKRDSCPKCGAFNNSHVNSSNNVSQNNEMPPPENIPAKPLSKPYYTKRIPLRHPESQYGYGYTTISRFNLKVPLIIIAIFVAINITVGSIMMFINVYKGSLPSNGYYLDNYNQIYYCQEKTTDENLWWLYNKDTKEWSQFTTLKNTKRPKGVRYSESNLFDISSNLNINHRDVDISHSKSFIDDGNHKEPQTAYYYYNNTLYYYLNDFSESYIPVDNSGWYIYNDQWEYYCSADDKETLGNDLWYTDTDYKVGTNINNIYNYNNEIPLDWHPESFTSTSWYYSYKQNKESYLNNTLYSINNSTQIK